MRCDKCEVKGKVLVKVLLDIYDSENAKTAFTQRAWWCPRCVNNGAMEAARITIAALTKKTKRLEKMLGRCKS